MIQTTNVAVTNNIDFPTKSRLSTCLSKYISLQPYDAPQRPVVQNLET